MDIVDNINKIKVAFGARDIVFGAIALSISFVLWIFPVFRLPFGAHVTLASPLPMLLYGYFFGLKKALVVALGHMLLTLMYFPYIVSPWSAVLDYVVPSLSMAAAGLVDFRPKGDKLTGLRTHNKFYIGLMICFVVRLASHTWAGIVFWSKDIDFAIWSGDLVGFDALMYSLVYNLAYLVPETILVIVASVMVFNSSQLVKTIVR
jgi:thiamine transporter